MEFVKFSFLTAFTFAALAVLTVAPLAETQAQDEGAAKKPRWTYDEIVNDPEFKGYENYVKFAVLWAHFWDKGTVDRLGDYLIVGVPTPTGTKTKFYVYSSNVHPELIAIALLGSALSPSVVKGLRDDPQFRSFYIQMCLYYLPYLEAQEKLGFCNIDYLNELVSRSTNRNDYFFAHLSMGFIQVIASSAPQNCGYTKSDGISIEDSTFVFFPEGLDNWS